MRLDHPSVRMIEIVAKALGDLKDNFVFVGGSTVPLYLEDEGSQEPRPTEDVDCVVEITSYSEYAKLEETLRRKGFANSIKPKDPMCRWIVGGVTVDIMPTDARVIGFSNKWYKERISEAIEAMLPS